MGSSSGVEVGPVNRAVLGLLAFHMSCKDKREVNGGIRAVCLG